MTGCRTARQKVSLDIFRSKTKPLKTRQPFSSDVRAQEIVEDLEAAKGFVQILACLESRVKRESKLPRMVRGEENIRLG
jgi:hypothetical protein